MRSAPIGCGTIICMVVGRNQGGVLVYFRLGTRTVSIAMDVYPCDMGG